ncbi:MAG: phage antirepressor N-terminal domain-containing protein [Burkholderiaceae bacterium]|nr:phage antirepressor N-terminal domain-containing protein [Burkholderiaceae bacterium]
MTFNFSDRNFPTVARADGTMVVAVKPICEAIGLAWDGQWEKTLNDNMRKRFGVCLEKVFHGGQMREMVCMRVDRVYAYLNSLNPDSIRSAGNEATADWIEQKQAEWADLMSRRLLMKQD